MQTSYLLITFICTIYVVAGIPVENVEEKIYPRFMEIPGDDGLMHKVDLEEEPDMELLNEIARNPANNNYLLYTRRNPSISQTLRINNAASVRLTNFNPGVPTVVVAHGWLGNGYTNLNPVVRRAYLNKADVNVIIVDWSRLALSTYPTAVRGVPDVGRGVGQFLIFLNQATGAPFNTMHLVGFSLGAHLVGNAGRALSGRAARVTGLDPAGPLWVTNTNRIRPSDGVYVEGIHTDGSAIGLGIGSSVADADFFPNGGNSQPGCITNICNHNRAWELFASTVTRNHLVGNQCSSMTQVTLNSCRGSTFHMGNDILTKSGSGIYRVNTGRSYPY